MSTYSASSLAFPTPGSKIRLPGLSASDIPAGFDAIVQFDRALLERQLQRNLVDQQLATLTSRMPYERGSLPDEILELTDPIVGVGHFATLTQYLIEVQLTGPRVTTLQSDLPMQPRLLDVDPPVAIGGSGSSSTIGSVPAPIAELRWTIRINLIARTRQLVATLGNVSSALSAPPPTEEQRTHLALGHARVPAHVDAEARQTSAELWAHLDFGGTRPVYAGDDAAASAFLSSDFGPSMLSAAIAPLLAAPPVRLTPLVALARGLSATALAATHLPPLRLRRRTVVATDGREVLCLCVDAGTNDRGTLEAVQAFVGTKNYAHYLGMRVLGPVLAARWNANPLLRIVVADVPIQFLESEDSEEILEGKARFRLWLRWPADRIVIEASDSGRGDPLRLETDLEILLTKAWDPNGEEIHEIGPLQDPGREAFVWNVHIFRDDPDPGATGPAKETLNSLAEVMFKSVLRPTVDEWRYDDVSGFTSSALAALFTSATLRRPDLPTAGDQPGRSLDVRLG